MWNSCENLKPNSKGLWHLLFLYLYLLALWRRLLMVTFIGMTHFDSRTETYRYLQYDALSFKSKSNVQKLVKLDKMLTFSILDTLYSGFYVLIIHYAMFWIFIYAYCLWIEGAHFTNSQEWAPDNSIIREKNSRIFSV